ncbi:hypothetical protein Fot_41093 [Forsythia ovata]|uniref:Uncharacterized protein n=1 Tax=Forsythia ovata TaxID=205694 RepID=A0ABD1RI21_9LAMI
MARSKTTTHHSEIRRSRRGAATTIATAVHPEFTPPRALVVSLPPSAAPRLLPPLVPPVSGTISSSLIPQPTAAANKVHSTAAILTQVTSHGEFDEDTSFDHGTGSQSSNKSDDSLRESPQTEHLEEQQHKLSSDFADENVEEEEESTNEEDDDLSAEETVFVKLSCAQNGKQKFDERSNVANLPSEH